MKSLITSSWVQVAVLCVMISFVLSATHVMSVYESATVAALIYASFALYKMLPTGFALAWPRQSADARSGARDEISQLAWLLFGRDRNVSYGGMKRVRESADAVFTSVGLDLEREADRNYVTARVGAKVTAALTQTERNLNQNELRRLVKFLDDIETITQQHPVPHHSPTTSAPSSLQGETS